MTTFEQATYCSHCDCGTALLGTVSAATATSSQSYNHFMIVNYDSRVVIWANLYYSRVVNYDRKVLYKIGHWIEFDFRFLSRGEAGHQAGHCLEHRQRNSDPSQCKMSTFT